MGNIGSSSGSARRERRRRGSGHQNNNPDSSHPPAHPQLAASSSPSSAAEISGNRYVFASPPATTTTSAYPTAHYPNPHGPLYYQYPGHQQLPAPLDHHHHHHHHWVGGYMAAPPPPPPQHQEGFSLVKRQKAVTIRNDVNLKKETLRMEPDELNPGCFLVAFTFDATVTGRISIFFFAREGADCSLTPAHASVGRPFTATFKEGIGQKFRQPAGSGISSAMLEEAERSLLQRDGEVYALAVKAEGSPPSGAGNSLITQAALEKREKGGRGWEARVVKQVLWVDGTRYELQEIYGIGNSVESEFDGNDPGKECVICLSEPRDTTVLPCRHMCMCSECAKVLGLQTNRCPICRQPIERLLEIKVNGGDSPPPADEKL